MALTNQQYNMLLHQFDEKRRRADFALEERREHIYSEIPRIKEIDDRIAHESIKRAKLAISGDRSALDGIDVDNARLKGQKEALLLQHGYPADYLLPHYECSLCGDRGITNGRQCECFKRALTELIYNDSNLSAVLSRENFDNFNYGLFSDFKEDKDPVTSLTPRENIRNAVMTARDFIAHFDTSFENLLIYGNTGVGKTFLCSCIAKELLDAYRSVVYYSAYRFFNILEQLKFHHENSEGNSDIIDAGELTSCDLLILDDLGTELTNSFTVSELYYVLNERSLKSRSTIISTNLSLSDLNHRYTERIFSRLNKDYTFIKILGKDIRCL